MPKPARDVDLRSFSTANAVVERYRYNVLKNTNLITVSVTTSREADKHPATVNGTRVNGFTPPLPWSHSGRSFPTRGPSGSVSYEYAAPFNPYWYKYTSVPVQFLFPQISEMGVPWSTSDVNSMTSLAEIRALNKLKDQKVNAALFFAEGGKTANLIAEKLSQLADAVRHFKRRMTSKDWWKYYLTSPDKLSKRAAQEVLAFQYGIRPLVGDICGAIDHFTGGPRVPRVFVIGKATTSSSSLVSVNATNPLHIGPQAKYAWDVVTRCKVRLDYEMDNPNLATAEQLGISGVPELLWELVPYSFVIDWLVPVGEWLSALSADRGFSFIAGSCSLEEKAHAQCIRVIFNSHPYVSNLSGKIDPGSTSAFRFHRTVYVNSPIPALPIKNPISVEHTINAIALIRNMFR